MVPNAARQRVTGQVLGLGQERSQAALRELLAASERRNTPLDAVLLVGCAGGLDPNLRPGDLVVPARYRHPLRDPLEPDPGLLEQALEAAGSAGLRIHRGDSLTVDRLVAGAPEKLELGRRHAAAIVDLEDYWVAEVCAQAGVPFLAARAVLDPARQTLPDYLMTLADHEARVLGRALFQPWCLPTLLGLGVQLRAAQRSLTRLAAALVEYRGAEREDLTVAPP